MDCKDLMIGDWVYIHEPECKGHRIDYINEMDEEVGADGELYSINDIRPIPLTEEILVKNGFLKRSDKEYYLKDDIVIFVGSDSCEVCTLYGEYTAYSYVEEGYTTIATIHYIHQLQHLLRLCGIEKEIEL